MTTKENKEEITKLKNRLSQLRDDMAQVRSELVHFKEAVAKDITKLVNLKQNK
jgi:hypothetical protein